MAKKFIFFFSSTADTDLAKETIKNILGKDTDFEFSLVPLTDLAAKRIEDIKVSSNIIILPKSKFMDQNGQLSALILNNYIDEKAIATAYVGVPSNNETLPYEIAREIKIPCVIANEYMYYDPNHAFWSQLKSLKKDNVQFAVTLKAAKKEIHSVLPQAKTVIVGHLSIDKALEQASTAKKLVNNKEHQQEEEMKNKELRKLLELNQKDEYAYISGTSQPIGIDRDLVEALLEELSKNSYPSLSLRFTIHPGVSNKDEYLQSLLKVCDKYPSLISQFKIILTSAVENELTTLKNSANLFLLRTEMSGPTAASIANKVAQAAPGAAVNEGVFLGLPTYCPFYNGAKPYLPSGWSKTIADFLRAKPGKTIDPAGLELDEQKCPQRLAKVLMS